mmetsp:Transcript_129725/g.238461  ORF Transcript_129725/g.238461 Transcript_129725/m.238461 type:complete len:214 (+) Transcript_129725:260-901(+)
MSRSTRRLVAVSGGVSIAQTKLSNCTPFSSSSTTTMPPLPGSMQEPKNFTMLGCHTCRKTRSSLLKSEMLNSPSELFGIFTATGAPKSSPCRTTPKPPQPSSFSCRIRTFVLSKSQCSISPCFRMAHRLSDRDTLSHDASTSKNMSSEFLESELGARSNLCVKPRTLLELLAKPCANPRTLLVLLDKLCLKLRMLPVLFASPRPVLSLDLSLP